MATPPSRTLLQADSMSGARKAVIAVLLSLSDGQSEAASLLRKATENGTTFMSSHRWALPRVLAVIQLFLRAPGCRAADLSHNSWKKTTVLHLLDRRLRALAELPLKVVVGRALVLQFGVWGCSALRKCEGRKAFRDIASAAWRTGQSSQCKVQDFARLQHLRLVLPLRCLGAQGLDPRVRLLPCLTQEGTSQQWKPQLRNPARLHGLLHTLLNLV